MTDSIRKEELVKFLLLVEIIYILRHASKLPGTVDNSQFYAQYFKTA